MGFVPSAQQTPICLLLSHCPFLLRVPYEVPRHCPREDMPSTVMRAHMTQSWPIRASHIPGSSDWFKDDHVIQVWPIRILPGTFYWISRGRW